MMRNVWRWLCDIMDPLDGYDGQQWVIQWNIKGNLPPWHHDRVVSIDSKERIVHVVDKHRDSWIYGGGYTNCWRSKASLERVIMANQRLLERIHAGEYKAWCMFERRLTPWGDM